MAAVKLNVFHWHLTETRVLELRVRSFQGCISWGRMALLHSGSNQEDHRLCANSVARVVPGSMPGHSTSWLVGHPDW